MRVDHATANPHRRILVIGINYWPEETGNAPYTTGLAEHLASEDHDVHVIAGMPYYPSWTIAPDYQQTLRKTEIRNGVTIHRFRQYIPSRQSAIRRAGFELSFLLHAMTARALPKPDVILGYLPSLSDGVLSVLAARRFDVPFGLVVQDLVGQSALQSGIQGGTRVAGITRLLEGWVAQKANGIAVVAEGFRPRLVELGVAPDRIHRVRNWTHVGRPTRCPAETRAQLGIPQDAKVCLHAGNMGLKQGLENVVDTARLAQRSDPDLLFVLMGGGNQRDFLMDRAKGLSNIMFLPSQPADGFPDALSAADILLVNQRPTVTDMSLPGKLTSYFSTGRPVIAAVAPESETQTEIGAANAGLVVQGGDPPKLLAAIRQLASDPAEAARLGCNGQRYAEQHLTASAALANLTDFLSKIR